MIASFLEAKDMDSYVTGNTIKRLREAKQMTQADLAMALGVSDKAVSKWETGKGYPDITLLEPIGAVLGISVAELLSGEKIINRNIAGNMLKSKIYVCPICGNVLHSTGDVMTSCCGINLPAIEPEDADDAHLINTESVEDETFVTVNHAMTKEHFISFLAYVSGDKFEMIKMYPEGNAEARFKLRGHGFLYCYCNKHCLMRKRV